MSCSCPPSPVVFRVPPDLREHAPDGAASVAICPRCLCTWPATDTGEAFGDPSFDAVADVFPAGDAGVALALAVGKLGSLALSREAVVELCERAEREGADVYLALDRLGAAGSVVPHFDIDRRRRQLRAFL